MTIMLPERCDRAAAQALMPELLAAAGNQPIEIDASRVSQIGQATLQLLLSARRTALGARITGSPALLEAAELAGMTDELFAEHGQ